MYILITNENSTSKKKELNENNFAKKISLKKFVDSLYKSLWNHLTNQAQNKQTGLVELKLDSPLSNLMLLIFENLTFGLSIIVSPYWSVAVLDFSKIKCRSIRSMIPLQHKPQALGALYCDIRSVCNFAGIVNICWILSICKVSYFFLCFVAAQWGHNLHSN